MLFAVLGLVIAGALFFVLNLLISANYDAGTGFIEDWIIRATCEHYELTGTIRDAAGKPVPYALVEASYYDERLTTRSAGDGRFALRADEAVCDRLPPEYVSVLVVADDFRPKRQSVPYESEPLEVTLDARDFRP